MEVQLQLEEMQQDLLLDARTKDEQVCDTALLSLLALLAQKYKY